MVSRNARLAMVSSRGGRDFDSRDALLGVVCSRRGREFRQRTGSGNVAFTTKYSKFRTFCWNQRVGMVLAGMVLADTR